MECFVGFISFRWFPDGCGLLRYFCSVCMGMFLIIGGIMAASILQIAFGGERFHNSLNDTDPPVEALIWPIWVFLTFLGCFFIYGSTIVTKEGRSDYDYSDESDI